MKNIVAVGSLVAVLSLWGASAHADGFAARMNAERMMSNAQAKAEAAQAAAAQAAARTTASVQMSVSPGTPPAQSPADVKMADNQAMQNAAAAVAKQESQMAMNDALMRAYMTDPALGRTAAVLQIVEQVATKSIDRIDADAQAQRDEAAHADRLAKELVKQ